MKSTAGQRRPYRMGARAEAAEATGRRIVEAAAALFGTALYEQVTLERVAAEAGTTVQTVIRRFGSKEGLFAEVIQCRRGEIHGRRAAVTPGDTGAALTVLLDEYERWGDEILLLLGQEARNPVIGAGVEAGRRFHHAWVAEVFGPRLAGAGARARRLALQQIGAATDLYVWKVLRRDLALDPRRARAAMSGMVDGIVSQARPEAT